MRSLVICALPLACLLAAQILGASIASPPVPIVAPVNDGYGDFVYVPAGSFQMGDNFGDGDPRERPVDKQQAADAALHVGTIDEVWSSDLRRAHRTAEIIAASQGLAVRVDPRLADKRAIR